LVELQEVDPVVLELTDLEWKEELYKKFGFTQRNFNFNE
jgi:chaperonin cofactor prefoldin